MNWKLDLIEQFPGIEIKDTDMQGLWGPLYIVTYAGGTNVINQSGIAEWCKDIERSNNWVPKVNKQ